jgi:hypothetical protein
MSVAGALRRVGLDVKGINAALTGINQSNCAPPLSDSEVKGIAKRAASYPSNICVNSAPEIVPMTIAINKIEPELVEWIWPGFLPLGKLAIIDGDPGVGKSTLALDLAARVSLGREMPDGSKGMKGGVIVLSAEDGPGDTIRPRLDAAGADVSCVTLLSAIKVNGHEQFPDIAEESHIEGIRTAIIEHNAKLIILDPFTAYVGSRANTNHDQDVRRTLTPLAQIAEHTGATVLVIRHLNKQQGLAAIYRGGGSIGITGAARSVFLVARDPDVDNGLVLASIKSNLAITPVSLRFTLQSIESGVARVVWNGTCDRTADDLLSSVAMRAVPKYSAVEIFLTDLLESGPIAAKEVYSEAKKQGFSKSTVERVKAKLKVQSNKSKSPDGEWLWSLPEIEDPHFQVSDDLRHQSPRQSTVSTNNFEHNSPYVEGPHPDNL